MKLEITDDKVREAAAKCSTADQVLRTLFPEAFTPSIKPGDIVRFKATHPSGDKRRFLVVGDDCGDVLSQHYKTLGPQQIWAIEVGTGKVYSWCSDSYVTLAEEKVR